MAVVHNHRGDGKRFTTVRNVETYEGNAISQNPFHTSWKRPSNSTCNTVECKFIEHQKWLDVWVFPTARYEPQFSRRSRDNTIVVGDSKEEAMFHLQTLSADANVTLKKDRKRNVFIMWLLCFFGNWMQQQPDDD